ncbi:sensor histidine kinase [Haloarcula halophila]|uniref:sensor histidine kinase n=1 Tax=Haloarcula TaxID=2237 RepID=UPI0023E45C1E|nr:PAS domain-containing sensor histidine kinase [Halomicroarcula sp. DFY41]
MHRGVESVRIAMARLLTRPTERQWRIGGTLVLLVPALVVGSATVIRLGGRSTPAEGQVVASAALACIVAPLVVGARWLLTNDLDSGAVRRLVAWSLAGSLPITTLALVVVAYQRAHEIALADPYLVTAWVAGTGAVGGLLTGVYDVRRERERRRSERSRNRLKAIFETSPVALVAIDDDRTVRSWSSGAERLFGWTATEICDQQYPLVPADRTDEFQRHKAWVDAGNVIEGVATKRQRKDGSLIDVNVWSAPITDAADDSVSGHMIALADVTDRRQREQQLAVLERVLRHDIRNTVNVIEGNSTVLTEELDGELGTAARRIVDRAQQLGRLSEKAREVTEVLRSSSADRTIDAVSVLVRERRRIAAEYPDCPFVVDTPEVASVAGDERLGIAIREALENAVEHGYYGTPEGTDPEVRLGVTIETEHVVVDIEDTGPGIPERERRPLSDETETALQHGSGIGLWAIYWLVRSLGGEVTIADRDPQGTVVTMRLPRAGTQRPPQPGQIE